MKRIYWTSLALFALSNAAMLATASATMVDSGDLVKEVEQQHSRQPSAPVIEPELQTGRSATPIAPAYTPRPYQRPLFGAPDSPRDEETNELRGVDPYAN
jgi:hypothetical protein